MTQRTSRPPRSKTGLSLLRSLLQILLVLLWLQSTLFAVIVTDDISAHVVAPGQPTFGVNLDGVVSLQIAGVTGCNAGLISDRHLITTAHCFDIEIDNIIDFPPDTEVTAIFELPGGVETRTFLAEDVQLVDDWWENFGDLAVVTLPDVAPTEAPRYPIYRGTSEVGADIVVVGYGFTGTGDEGSSYFADEKIAGLNRYEAISEQLPPPLPHFLQGGTLVYDFDNGQTENNSLAILGIDSNTGIGSDEVKSAPGDSGAPTFWNGAIVGLSSFGHRPDQGDIDDIRNRSFGELSYDVRVSNWAEFIDAATGGTATFVDDPMGQPGDFNGDGMLDAEDVNQLLRASLTRDGDERLDLNVDGRVNDADIGIWVRDLAMTWFGDANLDGEFTSADLMTIAKSGHYEMDLPTLWHQGDFTADGRFSSDDLILALADGGYEQGPRASTAVPEPQSLMLMLVGLGWLMRLDCRSRRPNLF